MIINSPSISYPFLALFKRRKKIAMNGHPVFHQIAQNDLIDSWSKNVRRKKAMVVLSLRHSASTAVTTTKITRFVMDVWELLFGNDRNKVEQAHRRDFLSNLSVSPHIRGRSRSSALWLRLRAALVCSEVRFSYERFETLKRFLSILSVLIFDSKGDRAMPSLPAAAA